MATSRGILDARRVVVDAKDAVGQARSDMGNVCVAEFNRATDALSKLAEMLASSAGHYAAAEDDRAGRDGSKP
jgi:hypothetical protein